jgi:hypothetical protein
MSGVAGGEEPTERRPAWKPVMSRAEVDRWAAGSVYRSAVYHVTTVEAAESIRRDGFDLRRRAGGRAWGDGVYAAIDEMTRDEYLRQLSAQGVVLELRVDLRRVLKLRISISSRRQPFEHVLSVIPDGLARFVMARLVTASVSAALTHLMAETGYDAVEVVEGRFSVAIGGSQLVIFDPTRVVVLADENTGTE